MKLGMYIMANEPLSTANLTNPSHHCKATAWFSASFHLVLGNGSANMIPWQQIHATIQELFVSSFSMWSMSYQKQSL
jgi:hypothetical protein